ncbi:MAG: DEAD/DEAH box helicase, partial [Planctomycetes bacterium]|nr:DEAD/DEAH box helicase [Planctomycetota bacterium]
RVYKRAILPELCAEFDDAGRLLLCPRWRMPRRRGHDGHLAAEALLAGLISPDWYWDGRAFYPVQGLPPALREWFGARHQRTLEGDEIPDFLAGRAGSVAGAIPWRPSPAVARARGLAPRLCRVSIEQTPDGWLRLDPRYETDGHRLTLADLLEHPAHGRFLRRGNDWLLAPHDPLAEAARRSAAGGAATDAGGAGAGSDASALLRSPEGAISLALPPVEFLKLHAAWADDVALAPADGALAAEGFGPLLARLQRAEPIGKSPDPDGLVGALRPYQRAGYDWLWFLRSAGFHAVLADDMGLGKTHQTLALLLAARAEGADRPALVVCPTSVLDHWERKMREHAPALVPVRFHGAGRGKALPAFAPGQVVITTYSILTREAALLAKQPWEIVVLDEAQKVKNSKTQMARSAKQLDARFRLALTGTPIENRLSELWSIFDFVAPGYLGTVQSFRERFESPITRDQDPEARRVLRRLVHPFKLRRLKSDVLSELPAKMEDLRYCELSGQQAALYKAVVERDARPLVAGLRDADRKIEYLHILAVLTRLKQICDHPALVLDGERAQAFSSAKFELFREILEEALDSGQKVVVFSQFLDMLDLIEEHVKKLGVKASGLRGATRDRAQAIRRFQEDPECRVFVGSLLAGGLGIDLTAASVVIHYDRWWNAAREEQATDRVHRIGQTKGVQVIKLITTGTLEEKIDGMIRSKRALMDAVVESDESVIKKLTREDLIDLLTWAKT